MLRLQLHDGDCCRMFVAECYVSVLQELLRSVLRSSASVYLQVCAPVALSHTPRKRPRSNYPLANKQLTMEEESVTYHMFCFVTGNRASICDKFTHLFHITIMYIIEVVLVKWQPFDVKTFFLSERSRCSTNKQKTPLHCLLRIGYLRWLGMNNNNERGPRTSRWY